MTNTRKDTIDIIIEMVSDLEGKSIDEIQQEKYEKMEEWELEENERYLVNILYEGCD